MEGARKEADSASERLAEIFASLEKLKHQLIEWDERTVRQLLECVKVISNERLLAVFRGGVVRVVAMGVMP